MNQHSDTIIFIIALVIFVIYRRVRRNIGWQQLNPRKLLVRTCLFIFIGLIFLAGGISHPISLLSDVIGILVGIILAYYGATLTSFEQREGRLHYRPNIWIGSTVTLLFLARLFYRFYNMYTAGIVTGLPQEQTNGFQTMSFTTGQSWTAGLMLIMFAYYIFYYLILIKKQKQLSMQGK
ncbi:hypothetical protein RCG19_20545 [Neobacillus sp. OS1-2]|uniref:hypothetical protein n=1 Tax=Neobacillus sp. OS1-2 TaxID=3070680 RepID=UPI0027E0CC62|nr:hypothetical protein [Neobacillus sp. OS1-2]WML39540.1 hypothetical protein RCG19_20545 [Neobacillus sp. OS1-2]